MRTIYTLLLLIFTLVLPGRASQILGGAIQVTQLAGQTYQIQVQLLSDAANEASAMEQLLVCFGDGQTATFSLSHTQPAEEGEGMIMQTYTGEHTYSDAGTYQIAVSSSPRSSSILNQSESIHKNLFLWTVINTNFSNNTPKVGSLARVAGLRQAFTAPLVGADIESDSITYKLAKTAIPSPGTCGVRMQAKGFVYPNDVEKEGVFYIDGSNQLNWTAPTRSGNFYYAVIATEWRQGVKISESYQESTLMVLEKPGEQISIPAYQSAEVSMIRPSSNTGELDSGPSLTVEAYPNPSDDHVKVIVSSKAQQPIEIQVLNVNGQVLELFQTGPVNQAETSFSLKRHGAGLYLIKAQNSDGSATRKLIVK